MFDVIVHYTNNEVIKFNDVIQAYADGAMLNLVRYDGNVYIDRHKIAWFYIPNKRLYDTLDRMIRDCVISYEGEENE